MTIDEAMTTNPVTLSLSNRPDIVEFREWLCSKTEFLNDTVKNVKISTRLYCIINGVDSVPVCKGEGCNELVPVKKDYLHKGFAKYCSITCARYGTEISNDRLALLKDKDWLFTNRIALRKSWDTISFEIGVSTPVIRKWAKYHDIQEIDYNKNSVEVEDILGNKEVLEEMYKSLSIYEISDKIGSSPSNIAVRIAKHGIPAKSSNDYPRKHDKISKGCQEVIDYIVSIYDGEVLINVRGIIPSKELDIYLPELNFAIEYNGVYSHLYRPHETSESRIKGKNYHRGKTIAARALGIQLIHIWSSVWDSKKDILKSMLSAKLKCSKNSIGARKCIVKQVSVGEKNTFLDSNHIQGRDKSTHRIALDCKGETVAIMTFGRSRYNKSYVWELSRFAVVNNTSVPGAFTKLLKSFRNEHEGSIISYADFSRSYGDVYEHNGFKLIAENPASYWYVAKNSEVMQHRFNFRKSKIAKHDDIRTEEQIMFCNGYSKIFDCGTLTFVYD